MNRWLRSFLQLALLFGIVFALVRFFPFVARLGEIAALGLREFWWLVLILSLGGWLIWILGKRNSG